MRKIHLGNISIEVILKDIKNIHLSVYPPNGKVKISAPSHMEIETIRIYALSKLNWIKRQQEKFVNQQRETPRDLINSESLYYLGNRYLLKIEETKGRGEVEIKHNKIVMKIKPGTGLDRREEILNHWYRTRLQDISEEIVKKWVKTINVNLNTINIRKMKTKWGSCSSTTGNIRINVELVKKPLECIEYIIVHELVHFKERTHNAKFIAYMDKYLPNWRHIKEELNKLPISYINWNY